MRAFLTIVAFAALASGCARALELRLAPSLGAPTDERPPALRPPPRERQELIVSLKVNGMGAGETNAYMTPSGEFLLPLAVLERRVRLPARAPRTRIDGEALVFVNEVPGALVEFDEEALVLRLAFPAEFFPRQSFRYRSDLHADLTVSRELSALLTYNVAGTALQGGGRAWNLSAESDFAYRGWLLRNQYLHFDSGDRSTSLRGLTQIVKDDPRRLTRLIAGDFFVTPTELTGGTVLGGLSYSRSFDLDPYFVRQPTAAFSGVAELPSDVTFLVGNTPVYRQRVAPGPFEIGNVSYITGQRDVRIVVRDIAGHERTILYPFYFSDQGLAAGLQDFSYQLGAIRQNASTRSADFGPAAFSATHRIGLNDTVTAGLHAEGTRDFTTGGPSVLLRSDRLGVVSLAFLASRDRSMAATGHAWSAQYTFQSGRFAGLAGAHRASPAFAFLRPESAMALAVRDDFVSISYGEASFGTLSLARRYTENVAAAPARDTSLSYSISFGRKSQWSLRAAYHRSTGLAAGSEVDVGVQYVPRIDFAATASHHSNDSGVRTASLDFGNIIPEGEGLGYHVALEHSSGPGGGFDTVSPALDYRMRSGELQVSGTSTSSRSGASGSVNASWGGSLAYVAGRFGLSRPTADSFALVQIEPPLANVRVRLNSQAFGTTDAAGRLFLPRLVSYLENQVTIEDKDIPIDYGLAAKTQVIVPQPHAGYVVAFDVRRVSAVSGMLRYRRGGRSLPLDSVLFTVERDGKPIELPTGSNGEFYIENVPAGDYRGEVQIDGTACRFTLSVPDAQEPVVNLPDVQTCELP